MTSTSTSGVGAPSTAANASSSSNLSSALPSANLDESDFLNLLITQLQNQDPMNPMDDQQFAVQLAQFSQLQTLMDIDSKVGTSSSAQELSSLSSYLGQDVVTNSTQVTVQNGSAGQASFNLADNADDVQVQLVDSGGNVVESVDAGAMNAGQQTVNLNNLTTTSGTYTLQVVATDATGDQLNPTAYAAGTVSGIIQGTTPMLIVNGQQVSPSNITEVLAAQSNSSS